MKKRHTTRVALGIAILCMVFVIAAAVAGLCFYK